MTNEELLAKAQALIAIESTAHNPDGLREAYNFMLAFVREHGKDLRIEEFESGDKPSFLAYRGPQRPEKFHLIFNGHVDVVPGKSEQYKPFIKDGKLYGRGAYDMKAACIVMADVFCEFADKVPFALGLQIVTDEETTGKHGTSYQVLDKGVRSEFVICGECGRALGTYDIGNSAKGTIVAEIGLRGKSSHGAYPWEGENAAVRASSFIDALHRRYPVPDEITHGSTVTVTAVTAVGHSHTMTPDQAVIKLNVRFVPDDPVLSSEEKFATFIEELDPQAEILTLHDFSSPFYTDPDNPQLRNLKAAAETVESHEFKFLQRHGTGDGRFYGTVGNPACEFGIPGMHKHAENEYIPVEGFENYRAALRLFLQREAAAAQSAPTK